MSSRKSNINLLSTVLIGTIAASLYAELLPTILSPKEKGVEILFNGKEKQQQENWVFGDGTPANWLLIDHALQSKKQNIKTKKHYKNFQLHAEFKVPYMPEAKGQGRGNSGIGLQGVYEIQVLDSFGIAEPGSGDCGSVYNQSAPLTNACKPPLEWQSYDITFRAPRYKNGKKTENARVTVFLNGVLVQNNTEIPGGTGIGGDEPKTEAAGPIVLQYHGNDVQFRDVWIKPLPEHGALHY